MGFQPATSRVTRCLPITMVGRGAGAAADRSPAADWPAQASPDAAAAADNCDRKCLRPVVLVWQRFAAIVQSSAWRAIGRARRLERRAAGNLALASDVAYGIRPTQGSATCWARACAARVRTSPAGVGRRRLTSRPAAGIRTAWHVIRRLRPQFLGCCADFCEAGRQRGNGVQRGIVNVEGHENGDVQFFGKPFPQAA